MRNARFCAPRVSLRRDFAIKSLMLAIVVVAGLSASCVVSALRSSTKCPFASALGINRSVAKGFKSLRSNRRCVSFLPPRPSLILRVA